jgi:hypothetical protein
LACLLCSRTLISLNEFRENFSTTLVACQSDAGIDFA